MLFNFQDFISNLKDNPEKKEVVSKYEKLVEKIPETIEECIWFKDYVKKFQTVKTKYPEDLKEDFDWDLLLQLIAASFSSEWILDKDEKDIRLIITVHSWDKSVVKKLDELWGFQILRLFEIYVEEQMNLQILLMEDEKEKDIIETQRWWNLERWKLVLDNLQAKEMRAAEEKDKADQIDDLMGQL